MDVAADISQRDEGPDRFDEWKMSRPGNHRNKMSRRNMGNNGNSGNMGSNGNIGNNGNMGTMDRIPPHTGHPQNHRIERNNSHHTNNHHNNKFNKGYYRPPHAQNIGSFKEHLRLQQQQQQQMQQAPAMQGQPQFGYNPMNQMNQFGVMNPMNPAQMAPQQEEQHDVVVDYGLDGDGSSDNNKNDGIYNNMKVETRGGS